MVGISIRQGASVRSVSRFRITSGCATMHKTFKNLNPHLNNAVSRSSIQIGNHSHTACIMLIVKRIKPLIRHTESRSAVGREAALSYRLLILIHHYNPFMFVVIKKPSLFLAYFMPIVEIHIQRLYNIYKDELIHTINTLSATAGVMTHFRIHRNTTITFFSYLQ